MTAGKISTAAALAGLHKAVLARVGRLHEGFDLDTRRGLIVAATALLCGTAAETKVPLPGAWKRKRREPEEAWLARQNALLANIPQNRLFSYPVGGGRALYFVKSASPLVLQHVPAAGSVRLGAAALAKLTLADVEGNLCRWDEWSGSYADATRPSL